MSEKRIIELLQSCIDNIIESNSDDSISTLINVVGFNKNELIELGFNESCFK